MRRNLFKSKLTYLFLTITFGTTVAKAELPNGALLTGPAMSSAIVTQPNILIGIDNSLQSASEVAWVPKTGLSYPTVPSGGTMADGYKYTAYNFKDASGNVTLKTFDDNRLTPFVLSATAPYTVQIKPSLSYGRTGELPAATSQYRNYTNLVIAKARSHYGNPMYYNPAMTYTPWNYLSHNTYKYGVTATTPFPATAAPLDVSISDTATVNLLQDFKYDILSSGMPLAPGANNANWEAHTIFDTGAPFSGTVTAPDYAADTFRLATYYVYRPQNTGGTLATRYIQLNPVNTPTVAGTIETFASGLTRYKKVVIDSATASYDWYPTRTDCVAQSAACTYAEELENFKNWFIYYRTKLNAQKATASWALSRLSSEYRIGLKRSYELSANPNFTNNTVPVAPYDAAGRLSVMNALFSTSYTTYPNHARLNLIGMGEYFKNQGTHNPWLDNTGGQSMSCRPSAAFLMTDGSSETTDISVYDSKYTTGASLASPSTPLNATVMYDSNGNPIGSSSTTGLYNVDSWSSPNRAQFSGLPSLSSIAHTNYWQDLMPSLNNSPLVGTSLPLSVVMESNSVPGGILIPAAGDPAAHQRLRLNVVSFGMPGANHPNYGKIGVERGGSSTLGGAYYVPTPTWGTFAYNSEQNELKNIDDLQQAALNGHGAFIEWQSSSRQMRLDPRVQLLHQMAAMLPRSSGTPSTLGWWYDEWVRTTSTAGVNGTTLLGEAAVTYQSNASSASYTETAVMEEPTTSGVPQTAFYESNFEKRDGSGGLFAVNGSGYLNAITSYQGLPFTPTTPLWYQFNGGRNLFFDANANPALWGGRKIFAPTMTSVMGALGPVIPFIPTYAETLPGNFSPPSTPATGASLPSFMMQAFFNNDSNLVWWLRGSHTRESVFKTRYDEMHKYPFRNRGWVDSLTYGTQTSRLGSIINSHPVAVRMQDFGYGADFTSGASYRAFLKTKINARPRVAVGSNDGFFHVFDGNADSYTTATGNDFTPVGTPTNSEELAYIPAGVMGNLKQQAHPHYMAHMKGIGVSDPDLGFRYTVDGPASTGDVQFTTGGGWKSVVTGSLGNGGKGLFAIDVTATDLASAPPTPMTAANVLWDKTVAGQWSATDWADVGAIRNRVGILKLVGGSFGVIMGNGANSDDGKSVLFVLNPQTGAVIKKITASTTGGGLMGVSFLFNFKREVVAVYGGDLKGNLWKFNLNDASPAAWSLGNGGNPLMTAKSAGNKIQPITARPALMEHPDGLGTLVMVGTGSNFRYNDEGLLAQHSIYGVLDKATVATTPAAANAAAFTATRSDLVEQTLSRLAGVTVSGGGEARTLTQNLVDYAAKKGWFVDLPNYGAQTKTYEAVTGDPRVVNERLVVTSANPVSAAGGYAFDTCDTLDVLTGAVTSFNPLTGGLLPFTVYDTNGDKRVDAADSNLATGYSTNAGKIASGVMPAITRSGSGYVLTKEGDVLAASRRAPVKSWRQLQLR